jgi:hypothetical protein
LYGLDDEWILGPPGVLGDQLVVKSFVTATLQAVPGSVAEHMYGGFAADDRQRRSSSPARRCPFGLIIVRLTG